MLSDNSTAPPPRALLFLIADTGGGHRASANAVKAEFEALHPGEFDIHIVDPFVEAAPRWTGRAANLYSPLIQHARWVWGGLYHTTNSRGAVRAIQATTLRAVRPGIARLCQKLKPAAVVSFHPLLNHVTAEVLRRNDVQRVPLITVITDLVDVHAAWACPSVDAVVTPSSGGLDRARRAGIPADRCYQFGLPVHRAFTEAAGDAEARRTLRRRLGLDPDGFVVLICGGADGSGGIDRRVRALAESGLRVELVAICGRNRAIQARLHGIRNRQGFPVIVKGFVENMADWLRAADAVVSKAGPGMIAEALCCGTPLLLSWYLPGQERGNVDWVVNVGAGRYVPGIAELVDTVGELARPGSATLQRMREAVNRVARPEATGDITDLIVRLAREGVPTTRQ